MSPIWQQEFWWWQLSAAAIFATRVLVVVAFRYCQFGNRNFGFLFALRSICCASYRLWLLAVYGENRDYQSYTFGFGAASGGTFFLFYFLTTTFDKFWWWRRTGVAASQDGEFWWWRHGCCCLSGWQNLVVAAARVSLPYVMASFGEDGVVDVAMEQADMRSSVVHGTTPCTRNPTLGVDRAPRGFANGGGASLHRCLVVERMRSARQMHPGVNMCMGAAVSRSREHNG